MKRNWEGEKRVERCPLISKARGSATLPLPTSKSNISSRRENFHYPVSTFSNYSWDRSKAKQGKGKKIQRPEERKGEKGEKKKPEQSVSWEKKNESRFRGGRRLKRRTTALCGERLGKRRRKTGLWGAEPLRCPTGRGGGCVRRPTQQAATVSQVQGTQQGSSEVKA